MQRLSEFAAKASLRVEGDGCVMVSSITADSRSVQPGSLFVAMPGVKADGTQYIASAIARGAVALLLPEGVVAPAGIAVLRATDMRAAVAALAAAFYPAQPKHIVAVTGTDGKTSTADFVRQMAGLLGHKAASIGTLGLRCPDAKLADAFPANNTSPEPILLHQTLSALAGAGVSHVAMEASSHGLDQKRMDGVQVRAGAFTNFARDHLDYHATLSAYFAAKALLFSHVLPIGSTVVLNRDDDQFAALTELCGKRSQHIISFGKHEDADYRVLEVTPHTQGISAQLVIDGKHHRIDVPLYGAFQLSNMLTAMGLLVACGEKAEALLPLLPQLQGVPGRLEKIASFNGAPIFIDYAHTPAALENILHTLRPHTEGKLHVVFGCGGDRDPGKRPEMGAVAVALADHVVVTDDNPRSEEPAAIRAAILAAAPHAIEIGDRAAAIRAAIAALNTGDVLVVAGKGHETTQTIGSQVIHFNDAEHIREATRP